MGQLVAVAKAIRMLGIDRHALQELIRNGDLPTFEGRVDLDELRQRYPSLALDDSSMLERTRLLRETAFSRRVRETVMPDQDVLARQFKKCKAELSVEQQKAKEYRAILDEFLRRLDDIRRKDDSGGCEMIESLNRWLLDRLQTQ